MRASREVCGGDACCAWMGVAQHGNAASRHKSVYSGSTHTGTPVLAIETGFDVVVCTCGRVCVCVRVQCSFCPLFSLVCTVAAAAHGWAARMRAKAAGPRRERLIHPAYHHHRGSHKRHFLDSQ